ncbi:MAG: glycoside hydrolase family 95 protein [Candidatus Gastranaerophilales bacterium]|nr:glycoside hydrolase family 95 protein [Candidatus Gastranaerophilales bacterium]
MKHILKMKYPSSWWHDLWREGLATGNGKTGVNLYGGAKKEILQLVRHDLWYNGLESEVPDVHEAFLRQRRKMDEGNFREASWEIVNALKQKGYTARLEAHIPVACLTVEQSPIKGFRSFLRQLDLDQAVASQQWTDAHIQMHREVFVSRAVDMAVYRIWAKNAENSKDLLDYKLELNAYHNTGETPTPAIEAVWETAQTEAVCEDEHTAYLYFNASRVKGNGENTDFGAVARISVTEGKLEPFENKIKAKAASLILVTICLYVDEPKKEAWQKLHDRLKNQTKSYEEMLAESVPLHRQLYHSAELHLGDQEPSESWSSFNEELTMEAFSEKQSAELIEKLWHFGRYLFICGSSPTSNPFPLYGLWGGGYQLQWCHNMANENLQMIYWHSLTGNLLEYNRAVFQYMNDKIPAFKENARKLYGIDGIYITAGTTPGVSSPTQIVPVIINWVGAAGWLAQHYFQYFLYTKDLVYAREIMLPYMDGVAAFYEAFVQFVPDDNGGEKIKFYPSVSPENTPSNFMPPEGKQMAHPMPTTVNSTIDLSILKEFFTNMLAVNEIWEESPFSQERVDKWNRILKAIPDFKSNEEGAVKEWQEDIFEDRYEHRHLSHIYPVFPGYELYAEKDPEQVKPYEKAVSLRKIDAQTGWSMAHMAAIYARFRNGEAAMECLDNMARSSLLNNFFTLHNDWREMNISLSTDPAPVQLDAIMGYVNAVQEMILYVSEGYIALLPALEERLYIGEVKNFRYTDGLLDMKWNRWNQKFACTITPFRPHKVQVVLPVFVEQIEWHKTGPVQISACRKRVWEVDFTALDTPDQTQVSIDS